MYNNANMFVQLKGKQIVGVYKKHPKHTLPSLLFTCMVWPKRLTAPFLTGEIKFAKDVTRARGRTLLLLGSWENKTDYTKYVLRCNDFIQAQTKLNPLTKQCLYKTGRQGTTKMTVVLHVKLEQYQITTECLIPVSVLYDSILNYFSWRITFKHVWHWIRSKNAQA